MAEHPDAIINLVRRFLASKLLQDDFNVVDCGSLNVGGADGGGGLALSTIPLKV